MRLPSTAPSATGSPAASSALVASTKLSRNSGSTVSLGPPSGGCVPISARSIVPSASPARSASVRFSLTVKSRSGRSRRSAGKMSGRRYGATVGIRPKRNGRFGLPLRLSTKPIRASVSSRILRARSTNSEPNGVIRTDLPSRSNSGAPQSSSSCRTCWLSAGCVTYDCSAARPKWPVSASTTAYWSCRRVGCGIRSYYHNE